LRILVTNDDGVDAPGIRPLAAALAADGHDVFVVAPVGDRSGSGAAIGKLFNVEAPGIASREWPDLPDVVVHALDAPPATAVLGAALGAFGAPPDLVASGINPGANTGHLVIHSGTVGAALTAAGLDIPGLAVSLPWSTEVDYHWDTAAACAAAAVEWVAKTDGGVPRVLNLNVPNLPLDQVLGVREADLAPHGEVWVASADASGGGLKLEFQGRADAAPGTDVAFVRDGYVAVTPLMSVVRAPVSGASDAVATALPRGR
jgi:5'-nucleotidase